MATKKFKQLPKDSQKAAFAQMDKDGTRQGRAVKSGGVLGGGRRQLDKMRISSSKAKKELSDVLTARSEVMTERSRIKYAKGAIAAGKGHPDYDWAKRRVGYFESSALPEANTKFKKELREFSSANKSKRAARVQPRSKQAKIF